MSYDADTNTLTLNGLVDSELSIYAYKMGNGFTINVVGQNVIRDISVEADDYAGNVIPTGLTTRTQCMFALQNTNSKEAWTTPTEKRIWRFWKTHGTSYSRLDIKTATAGIRRRSNSLTRLFFK